MIKNRRSYSESDCMKLLHKILSRYSTFLNNYLHEGWMKSNCVQFFHPTAEQQFEEHKLVSENLQRISKVKAEQKLLDVVDFQQDLRNVDEEKEPLHLLGLCLWDVFSNNHSVHDCNDVAYDLGSFRGSAATIAELINGRGEQNEEFNFDYLDYYMGTVWIKSRGDLQPFYEFIFTVLKEEQLEWEYSFPRMNIIHFSKEENTNPEEYSPEKAMEQELENKKVAAFQEELNRIYEEEFEEAKYRKPTPIIVAYQRVYGKLPDGHPQKQV